MTTSPVPAIQPIATAASRTFRSPNPNPHKIENKAQSKDNSRTDFKIMKDVTPLHHDPMVINFGRRRRPELIGKTAP